MYFGNLQQGSSGESVRQLQQALESLGYSVGSSGADGVYGPNTASAVRQFQSDQGITVDGIYGPVTQTRLAAALSSSSEELGWTAAPSTGSGSGGGAVASSVRPYPTTPMTSPAAPAAGSAAPSSGLLWAGVGLLGLAVVVGMSGPKKKRR